MQALAGLGADVRAADPHVPQETTDFALVDLTTTELALADAVVLVTDHDAFDYDLVRSHARYVLDTRNRMDGPAVERL